MSQQAKKATKVLLAFYFMSQGVRLASNLVVSRLVAPDVFGLMAIVVTILAGLKMFSDVGLEAYVMRSKDYRDKTVLDTVWSMQLIRGILLSTIVMIIAIFLGYLQPQESTETTGVFSNPVLPQVLMFIAIQPLFYGLRPLAALVFGRELQRTRIELVQFISQVTGASFTVIWALYSPSVWALAYGMVVTGAMNLTLSYLLFDLRHKFTWNKEIVSKVYHFGKWIVLSTALTYLSLYADRIFLGFKVSAEELGFYSIAVLLTGFLTTLINKSSGQILLPVFSNKREKSNLGLRASYYRVRLMQDVLVGTAIILTSLLADTIISVLYDERYKDVALFLKLVVIIAAPYSIRQASKVLLVALGQTKVQLQATIVNVVALALFIPILFEFYAVPGLIYAFIISSFLALIPQIIAMRKQNMFLFWSEIRVIPWVVILSLFL